MCWNVAVWTDPGGEGDLRWWVHEESAAKGTRCARVDAPGAAARVALGNMARETGAGTRRTGGERKTYKYGRKTSRSRQRLPGCFRSFRSSDCPHMEGDLPYWAWRGCVPAARNYRARRQCARHKLPLTLHIISKTTGGSTYKVAREVYVVRDDGCPNVRSQAESYKLTTNTQTTT